ncbi:TPA: glycosyltransferase, partial [Escherichia coli]|nr:glycosyltransferase [Escherichia coli]
MNSVNACLDKCINAELLLSIIVPVFNVQDYVEQCLLSIVDKRENDELSKVEIIVIDDGSTDNSRSVIEKLISKFPVIKLFTKQNGGLSDARNFGLNRASGKYIAFIDSDDIVDNEFIKIVLKCIENYS